MTDGLPTPSDRDFELLRSSRSRRYSRLVVKIAFGLLALFIIILFGAYMARLRSGDPLSVSYTRDRLIALDCSWADAFVQGWDGYRLWFARHGIASESAIFEDLSTLLADGMAHSNSAQIPEDELSAFGRVYLQTLSGSVRLVFVLIASLRLCLVLGLVSFFFGTLFYKPYRKSDALGQMGNGRVFYSGARAGLDNLTPEGLPDVQIRGFACPQRSTPAAAKASPVWQVLSQYGALNSTNEALVQTIVRYADVAPYVAAAGEEGELARTFSEGSLLTNTVEVVRAALSVHASVHAPRGPDSPDEQTGHNTRALSSAEYAEELGRAFAQVLTPRLRETLAALPACEVATLVLAFESGKILAHAFEGGKWVRKSNFPHLNARAVLHSLAEYPQDYDAYSRNRIRRGLIYAARKSAFSPVRMPLDMDDECWAFRQWAEILLATPHEMRAAAREVELVAIIREVHAHWCNEFFEASSSSAAALRKVGFATNTGLLMLPVADIVMCMRRFVSSETISRMHVLITQVLAHQLMQQARESDSDAGPTLQLSFDKLDPQPSAGDIATLAAIHQIAEVDIKDWLALRVVLAAYGWLASRVGDYSVPTTSIIFAVFRCSTGLQGTNALGLLGRPGMIPLRGTKLSERWGQDWSARFTVVERATMAETLEDYGKLLQGIEELKPVEDEILGPTSTVQA